MSRLILAFAVLAAASFTFAHGAYAQRAMAHPLPHPAAVKHGTAAVAHPRQPSAARA